MFKVIFFKLGQRISDDDLAVEYETRGLTPDPYAVAKVNEADPAFADKHPNCAHWKDKNGRWCYILFGRDSFVHGVRVDHNDDGWGDDWWFGGVLK